MKYIEADIYSSKSKKDLLIGFLYDEDYYTLEEITNDLAKELNQDEKDWDYVSDISNNLKDDELIVRVYPSDEKSALDLKEKLEENNLGTLKFFEKEIDKHIKDGLIEVKKDKICLSKKGRDLSNIVEVDFIK